MSELVGKKVSSFVRRITPVALIALIVAILIWSFSTSGENDRKVTCISNQKALEQCIIAWRDANPEVPLEAGSLGPGGTASPNIGTLTGALDRDNLFDCPSTGEYELGPDYYMDSEGNVACDADDQSDSRVDGDRATERTTFDHSSN